MDILPPPADGPPNEDPVVEKVRQRQLVRARRAARPAPERDRVATILAEVVLGSGCLDSARRVTCYISGPTEPGTGPLRAALAARGVEVLLPVVAAGEQLHWRLDEHPAGPAVPVGASLGVGAAETADVLLVPALAVDPHGHRLGQGGGYYDRLLGAAGRRPLVVALLHDDELMTVDLPVQAHDEPVDAVATPTRFVDLRGTPTQNQTQTQTQT